MVCSQNRPDHLTTATKAEQHQVLADTHKAHRAGGGEPDSEGNRVGFSHPKCHQGSHALFRVLDSLLLQPEAE